MATKHPNWDKQPSGLFKVVTDTTGFVETKGGRGACFEWYRFVDNQWKAIHILHEENWMLKTNGI